jgi:hypothetical protein
MCIEFDDENSFLMMSIEKNNCFCYFSAIFSFSFTIASIMFVLKKIFAAVYYQWNVDYSSFISFVFKKNARSSV